MNLLSWAEKLYGADSPSDIVALHVKDTVCAFLAGARASEGRALARLQGARVAARAAAVARLSECDDIHLPSCVTPGAAVIPVALSLAMNRSDEDFRRAVAAGYASGLGLGKAIGGARALAHGVWPTLLAAPVMAAVTASRLLGHDAQTLAHAMAMALAGSNGRAGRPKGAPSGRWFLFCEAVARGIAAAEAAGAGFHADPTILSESWLALQAGHDAIDMNALETQPSVASTGFKPFPVARQGVNAIEAFRRILSGGVAPAKIDTIDVFVPNMNVALLSRPVAEDDRLSRLCNMGFQLACAALAPDLLFEPERRTTVPLTEFASRVSIRPDTTLESHLPGNWASRVVVKAGREIFEETAVHSEFDPGAPQLPAALENKWGRLAREDADLLSGGPAGLWQQIERRVTMAGEREG